MELAEDLDKLISETIESFNLPGVAVGVVRRNSVAYAKGFGVLNADTGGEVTEHTLFHMASVAKPFVATAIMQLVEQGKIDLDERVKTYLPYFTLADERYREITIRQMLSHSSGMPDVQDYGWDHPEYDEGALERYARSLTDQSLLFDPGQNFRYSNMAFNVLGDVICKVSGQPFSDYVKAHILNPLGMRNSTFLFEMPPELVASPHIQGLTPVVSPIYPYHRAHGPSSTLHSNVLETCNWAMANLNRGEYGGSRILQSGSYDVLWKPHTRVNETASAGLSWLIREHKGHRAVVHAGGDLGFGSMLILLPELSIAVVMMKNADFGPGEELAHAVLDYALGDEPEPLRAPVMYPIAKTIAEEGIEKSVERYYELRGEESCTYAFDESHLSTLGYFLLSLGKVREAKEIFRLNMEVYPDSSNVYDSYAEACTISGDRRDAIVNYKKSLELDPGNQNAVEKLKMLREQ